MAKLKVLVCPAHYLIDDRSHGSEYVWPVGLMRACVEAGDTEFVAILLPERSVPRHPMQRVSSNFPKGYLPIPRNYLSGEQKESLKKDENYPWIAL